MALLPVRKLLPSLFSLPQLFVFVVSLRLSSGESLEVAFAFVRTKLPGRTSSAEESGRSRARREPRPTDPVFEGGPASDENRMRRDPSSKGPTFLKGSRDGAWIPCDWAHAREPSHPIFRHTPILPYTPHPPLIHPVSCAELPPRVHRNILTEQEHPHGAGTSFTRFSQNSSTCHLTPKRHGVGQNYDSLNRRTIPHKNGSRSRHAATPIAPPLKPPHRASPPGRDPEFGGPVSNVTVIKGRDAVLGCRVDDLRGFKVAWVKVDTQTILTIHHHVISRNARLALEHDDLVGRKWDLRISDAQEEDRGWYLCQVNTSPMKSQKGYLQVVVPPEILDEGSTGGDVIEKEGEDVLFRCQAKGYPHPYITWRREDEKPFKLADALVTVMNGPELRLKKINRLHMGAYLCIASNGVPPSQSKRFNLKVQFPPMLWVPSQLEGAYVGQASVVLRCHTEAFPESINYWLDEFDQMIRPGEKYDMTTNRTGSHVTMTLTVKDITLRDLKGYQCIAKNSLGQTVGSIRLEEVERPIQEAETESIVPPPQGQNHQGQNHQGQSLQ
ncbi:unnamed protein product, partial [Darwinula stevensoni]